MSRRGVNREAARLIRNVSQQLPFSDMQRLALIASAVTVTAACTPGPLPPVHEPTGYDTVRVDLPNCAVQLPPVVDRTGNVAEFIAKNLDADKLCAAVTALKRWIESGAIPPPDLQPDDWKRVKSIAVSRTGFAGSDSGGVISYRLSLEADIPNRPRLVGVALLARIHRSNAVFRCASGRSLKSIAAAGCLPLSDG